MARVPPLCHVFCVPPREAFGGGARAPFPNSLLSVNRSIWCKIHVSRLIFRLNTKKVPGKLLGTKTTFKPPKGTPVGEPPRFRLFAWSCFTAFYVLAVSMKETNTCCKSCKSMALKMTIFNQYWIKIDGNYNIAVFIYMHQIRKSNDNIVILVQCWYSLK